MIRKSQVNQVQLVEVVPMAQQQDKLLEDSEAI